MIPYVMTTGQLLTWMEENYDVVWKKWKSGNTSVISLVKFEYKVLKRNQKIMETKPNVGMFAPCWKGNLLEKQDEEKEETNIMKSAKAQVLFADMLVEHKGSRIEVTVDRTCVFCNEWSNPLTVEKLILDSPKKIKPTLSYLTEIGLE